MYIFVRYLSYSLFKIHRKLTSGYLLCVNASLSKMVEEVLISFFFFVQRHLVRCYSTRQA